MHMTKKFWSCMALALMLGAMLVLGGCTNGAGQGDATSSGASATKVEDRQAPKVPEDKKTEDKQSGKVQQLDIKVYYPDDQGMKLVAVKRQIKFDGKTDKYTAAMNSLLQGTKEKGKTTIIPKQAKLNKVTFADGTVTVDFDNGLV